MKLKPLDDAFSVYIRLRDANEQGVCFCITCGKPHFWRDMDNGHGIPREHLGTRFHEQNCHAQCRHCNHYGKGRMDLYSRKVDKLYGEGTWDKLWVLSKQTHKLFPFEIKALAKHYREEAKRIKKEKGIPDQL